MSSTHTVMVSYGLRRFPPRTNQRTEPKPTESTTTINSNVQSPSYIDANIQSLPEVSSTTAKPITAAESPLTKFLFQLLSSLLIFLLLVAAVGIPIGLILTDTIHSEDTKTTASTTTITTTVTVTLPPTYIYWPMDSSFNDFYNVYNGVGANSPSFITPGYNGYGAALSVNRADAQYVLVSPYKNMTYTSFTWEIWAYPINLENYDNIMLGMCQTLSTNECLYLMIRQNSTYFGFYGNDCWSSTIVSINQWHHFAFVYDYSVQAQYVYLNGYLTCTHRPSAPFQAMSGAITIGAINNTGTGTPYWYWTGYIDEVQYVSRAKSAAEVLEDATLVAYYSFDNGSFYDSGPNRINGTGVNVTSVTGRMNQGLLFNGNGQSFKATGLTLIGAVYRSYSISVWIYRSSPAVGYGTIIHLSAVPAGFGGWCVPILGLSTSYQVIGQNWNSSYFAAVTGPVIPLATWVHLVTSYSATSGVRLWVNGILIQSSGPFFYRPSGVPSTIGVGSALGSVGNCATGNIAHGPFYGIIDEVRVYARELNAAEVSVLANP